jgi:hypothetical protein
MRQKRMSLGWAARVGKRYEVLSGDWVLVLWCRIWLRRHAGSMAKRLRWSATGPERALARWAVVASALILVLAMPVAAWWLVGDQSTVPVSMDPDYAFRPWRIGPMAARAAGIGSVAADGVAAAVLLGVTLRGRLDVRWWAVLVPLLTAGFIAGAGWRVLTAGVIGANIGAGLVVMVGGPIVLGLLIWALVFSVHLSRSGGAGTPPASPKTR